MTTRARAHRATHAPEQELRPALDEFREEAQIVNGVGSAAVKRIAAAIHLPVSTVRGAVSSFDECKHNPNTLRVCTGTSCTLTGGTEVARELGRDHHCSGIYCLGYCDRSPVAMNAAGQPPANSARWSVASGVRQPPAAALRLSAACSCQVTAEIRAAAAARSRQSKDAHT